MLPDADPWRFKNVRGLFAVSSQRFSAADVRRWCAFDYAAVSRRRSGKAKPISLKIGILSGEFPCG